MTEKDYNGLIFNNGRLIFNNFTKLTKILHLGERKFNATGFVSFQ